MINRCDLMLQDLKHFKTVIMSSYKTFQSVTKCHKVSQIVTNFTKHSFRDGGGGEWW